MQNIRQNILICVFFLSAVVVFFHQTLREGKLPVPTDTLIGLYHPWRDLYADTFPRGVPFKNFLITDPIRQQIPWRKLAIDSWKSGNVPALNPYVFAGVPLDANIQAGVFYPLNLLFLMFEFPIAWTVLIMVQPLLSMVFMYMYLRKLRMSTLAGMTGAVVWTFSGFSIAWLTWGTIVHTALWLPLLLYAVESLFDTSIASRRKQVMNGSLFGISVLMILLAGHIQIAVYVLAAACWYILWRLHTVRSHGRTFVWSGAMMMVWATGIGICAGAIQWMRIAEYLPFTGRITDVTHWTQPGWFLPWQHLIQFLVPDFFGNPTTLNYWGVWNYGEFIGYIGVIPFIFALSAFGFAGVGGFFTTLMIVSLLFMLPSPLSLLPYTLHVPVLSVLQPTRLMVLVDFSLAVLCAFGVDYFRAGERRKLVRSCVAVSIVLISVWVIVMSGQRIFGDPAMIGNLSVARRNLIVPTLLLVCFMTCIGIGTRKISGKGYFGVVALLLLLITTDLFRFGWKFTPFTPRAYFFPPTRITEFLSRQEKPFRIMSLDDRIMPPNVSAYYGLETIEGYDPLAPKLYEDFLRVSEGGLESLKRPSAYNRIYAVRNTDSALFPYMNIRFVLSLDEINKPDFREVMKEGETIVYEYSRFMPRVFLAEKTIRVTDPTEVLAALYGSPDMRLGVHADALDIIDTPVTGDEEAIITSYEPNRIRIHTDTRNQRLLVIGNRYDVRWSARLDNAESLAVIPVNYLFMGITIPVGPHDIILSYR